MGVEAVNYAAAALGGLQRLQTLNLCFAGSFTVLLRFGISPSKIGSFIGDTGACKKFWCIVGDLFGFGFTFTGACPGLSIASTLALLATQIRLFYICLCCSGYDGVHKYFFWLCLSGGVGQFESVVATGTTGAGGSIAWYFLCMELYTIFLPFLFWLVSVIVSRLGYIDIEYCKLFWQLLSMVFLTFASFVAWCCNMKNPNAFAGGSSSDSAKESETIQNALSPWVLGFVGFGIMFWVFPAVCPFMVCHYAHFRFVMLFAPVLGCIATVIAWFINEANDGRFDVGSISWAKKCHFHGWMGLQIGTDRNFVKNGPFWNFTWLFVIGSVILFRIIISCLHHPNGFVARSVLHSRWAVFWGSLFFFCSCSAKAFGLNGCAANIFTAVSKEETNKHPKEGQKGFNSSCFAISLITMTISLFTTQAYSGGYSSFKCAANSGCSWPTQGVGSFRGFWFWLCYGLRYGTKRFFSVSGLKDGIIFIIRGFIRIINSIRKVL